MIRKAYNRIRKHIWDKAHNKLNVSNRQRLTVCDTTIISMNCTGGVISHDLGLQFRSPTVNLFMRAEDFTKFCERLEYYLNIDEITECKDKSIIEDRTYPIGRLDDLTLFFVHYHSFEEAVQKWNERKKRVNWDNIVIINTDREGMTDELKDRFEKLPYRKVMFVHKPDKLHPSCFYLKGYESEKSVGIVTEPIGWKGLRPIDQFDYVAFLNANGGVINS